MRTLHVHVPTCVVLTACHRRTLQVKNDGQRLDEELNEVRQELEKQAGFIRSAFNYYSMIGGGICESGEKPLLGHIRSCIIMRKFRIEKLCSAVTAMAVTRIAPCLRACRALTPPRPLAERWAFLFLPPIAAASSDILQMGANVWLNFCNDAGIVHPSQRGCTVQDLQVWRGKGRLGELGLGAGRCSMRHHAGGAEAAYHCPPCNTQLCRPSLSP